MTGVICAIGAGVGFGVFQAVNRRANQEMDAYRATFLLLVVGSVALSVWTLATRDLSVLADARPESFLYFSSAGIVHFFLGWTFLSLSQQRVGAAATGAVLGSTPLVGSVLAALVLEEGLTVVAIFGIVLVVVGVIVLSTRQRGTSSLTRTIPWFALAAAFSWGSSPLFIRWGLEGLDDPFIGVTIGLLAGAAAYAVALGLSRQKRAAAPIPGSAVRWVVAAGLLVAFGITLQWIAFDLIAIAVAITLMQLSAPTVITVAPFVVRSEAERPTVSLIVGAAAVLSGSVLVVLSGM